jgi:LemA protein
MLRLVGVIYLTEELVMTALLILGGIILLLILWVAGIYNRLVNLRNQVKNAWSQIDVQLQRRYDLIPNLIESVKGYMEHEKGTLLAVVEARNKAAAARQGIADKGGPTDEGSLKALMSAESALKGAMGNFFALAENYPQLKANENMLSLQEELSTTENKVAFARQAYNDQVMLYNNAQQEFPAVLVAGAFGHHLADMYEISDAEAKKAPKVSFS